MTAIWSLEEKRQLLCGLYQYGSANVENLQKLLPDKTTAEIKLMCEEHAKLALIKREKSCKTTPVKLWLQIFKRLKQMQTDQCDDVVPRVLKYIGLFEKRMSQKSRHLSQCYLILSKMCQGLDLEKFDEKNGYFVYKCLTNLARHLKYGEYRTYQKHIALINEMKHLYFHRNNLNTKLEKSLTLNPMAIPQRLLEMTRLELNDMQSVHI